MTAPGDSERLRPLRSDDAKGFDQKLLDRTVIAIPLLEAIAAAPSPMRRVVVTAEPVTSIDVTSADMLADLRQTLQESGIELCFAEMKDPVKDKLRRFELFDRFGASSFHPTIGAAVDAYLEQHAVDWVP